MSIPKTNSPDYPRRGERKKERMNLSLWDLLAGQARNAANSFSIELSNGEFAAVAMENSL